MQRPRLTSLRERENRSTLMRNDRLQWITSLIMDNSSQKRSKRLVIHYDSFFVSGYWQTLVAIFRYGAVTVVAKSATPADVKAKAVEVLYKREVPARKIAENFGVNREILYGWKRDVLGENFPAKQIPSPVDEEKDQENITPKVSDLQARIKALELQNDILLQVNALLKKIWASTRSTWLIGKRFKWLMPYVIGIRLIRCLRLFSYQRVGYWRHRQKRQVQGNTGTHENHL